MAVDIPLLPANMFLRGFVMLSIMSNMTRSFRRCPSSLVSATYPGALAPVHQFGQSKAVHIARRPAKHRRDIGHGILYAFGNSMLAFSAFGIKKPAKMPPNAT
ncbi:hypothetical protein WS83_01760 [Burkholderia sp. MSMB2042]|nr:hypothetical protein WS83_01760 [Burkholderia sp. MSMB2042]